MESEVSIAKEHRQDGYPERHAFVTKLCTAEKSKGSDRCEIPRVWKETQCRGRKHQADKKPMTITWMGCHNDRGVVSVPVGGLSSVKPVRNGPGLKVLKDHPAASARLWGTQICPGL